MALYFDRGGKRITYEEHKKLMAEPGYRVVREFDNGVVQVRLIFNGTLTLQQKASFRDTWPLFTLLVQNYDAEGVLRADPVMDGQTFAHMSDAINTYEEFLLNWTDCRVEDDGKFVEVDNTLAPPPPPDPDAPTSSIKGLPSDFAAW